MCKNNNCEAVCEVYEFHTIKIAYNQSINRKSINRSCVITEKMHSCWLTNDDITDKYVFMTGGD